MSFVLFCYIHMAVSSQFKKLEHCDPVIHSPNHGRISQKGIIKVQLFYALPIFTHTQLITVKQLMFSSRASSPETVQLHISLLLHILQVVVEEKLCSKMEQKILEGSKSCASHSV